MVEGFVELGFTDFFDERCETGTGMTKTKGSQAASTVRNEAERMSKRTCRYSCSRNETCRDLHIHYRFFKLVPLFC